MKELEEVGLVGGSDMNNFYKNLADYRLQVIITLANLNRLTSMTSHNQDDEKNELISKLNQFLSCDIHYFNIKKEKADMMWYEIGLAIDRLYEIINNKNVVELIKDHIKELQKLFFDIYNNK